MVIIQRTKNIFRNPHKIYSVFRNPRNSISILKRSLLGIQFSEVIAEFNDFSMRNNSNSLFNLSKSDLSDSFRDLAIRLNAGKQNRHGEIYAKIIPHLHDGENILEVGIGSTSSSLPSTMGPRGSNGASLHLWSSLFPLSKIIGGDIDKSSFVSSNNIECYEVDQRSNSSLENLCNNLSKLGTFQLIVDDGLHSPEANLRTFNYLSNLIRPGGFWVTEDIDHVYSGLFRVFAMAQTDFDGNYFEIPIPGQTDAGFLVLQKKQEDYS